jgi:hypothetical protein
MGASIAAARGKTSALEAALSAERLKKASASIAERRQMNLVMDPTIGSVNTEPIWGPEPRFSRFSAENLAAGGTRRSEAGAGGAA